MTRFSARNTLKIFCVSIDVVFYLVCLSGGIFLAVLLYPSNVEHKWDYDIALEILKIISPIFASLILYDTIKDSVMGTLAFFSKKNTDVDDKH